MFIICGPRAALKLCYTSAAVASTSHPRHAIQFGVFEADLRSGELYKHGARIKLQKVPFQILTLLLQHPAEVVTREELRQAIWPEDTFVDFDAGLDAAIWKLRQALGDGAENPRFIETLPKRGYRFIAPVSEWEPHQQATMPVVPGPSASGRPRPSETSAAKAGIIWRWTVAAVVLAVLALSAWRFTARAGNSYAIAVLPFTNLSSEPGSDYFSDGLTDEVIRNLSLIDGLEVKSRTSSFEFKGKPRNIREVGSKLAANLVLEGSVLHADDELRINVALVRVSDDSILWSQRYDRPLKDIFAIQDEISRSIVNELRLKGVGRQRRYNTNLEAYDLYLQASALGNKRIGHQQDVSRSIELFQQVIARDPNFAPAYAGLARDYAYLSANPRFGIFSAEDGYVKMRMAAEKALELDPLLAEAYDARGQVLVRDLAWAEAEKNFRRAMQLDPNLSGAHRDLAILVLQPFGKMEEAAREMRKAIELDPAAGFSYGLAYILMSDRRYDEALDVCHRSLAADPNDALMLQLYGRILVQKGRPAAAIALLQNRKGSEHFLGYAYAKAGRHAEATQLAVQMSQWPNVTAVIEAGLGNKDRVFEDLDKMAAMRDQRTDAYPWFPEFFLLRADARMNEFRRKRGLPPVQ